MVCGEEKRQRRRESSAERADGRWEARYWKDGKRRSVYGSTRKEAAEKLVKALANKDEAPAGFEPTNITVREFFEQYDDVARDTMKRRSYETYRDIARLHLLPAFGTMKLRALDREHIQRLYRHKRHDGLSAARVKRIHGVLASALNTAVRWRLIDRNPCARFRLRECLSRRYARSASTKPSCSWLPLEGDRYEALYVLG